MSKKIHLDYEKVYELYIVKNTSLGECAKVFNCSKTSVYNFVSKNNLVKSKEEVYASKCLTKINHFGDPTYSNPKKAIETKVTRYGSAYPKEWFEKRKSTLIAKQGSMCSEGQIAKCKATKLKNHGDENYHNVEQMKKTKIDKYGCYETIDQIRKSKETKMERYGYPTWNMTKAKETKLKKYGSMNGPEQVAKAKETKLEKYGDENYNNIEKTKKTNIKKYGVEMSLKNPEVFKKAITTMNSNGNDSQEEFKLFDYLILKYGKDNVIRQYSDSRYPYHCDFYIPSEDLFIEYNGYWTHNDHQFDKTSIHDMVQLGRWKIKAKEHPAYIDAIKTWSKKDVEKSDCAKKNNLNYLIIYRNDLAKLIEEKKYIKED